MTNIATLNIIMTQFYDLDFFWAQIFEIQPILAKNPPEPNFLP